MDLEADFRLEKDVVLRALRQLKVTNIVEKGNGFSGNFPESNMFFYFSEEFSDPTLRAEDWSEKITWDVKMRMVFYYVISTYDLCSEQLHQFLELLSQLCSANYILSFQYEKVVAIRDEDGLHILHNF
ncbi:MULTISPECIES: hypothetical protein [Herbaspirillum]|nr:MULTISPECIES: hypothetical protein [Herbaspirillum]